MQLDDLVRSIFCVTRGGRPYGTAFVVELEAPGHGQPLRYAALTCERVVREAGLEPGSVEPLTLVSFAPGGADFEATVSWGDVHPEADLALLHFEPGLDIKRWAPTSLPLSLDDRASGHDVLTYGLASPDRAEGRFSLLGGRPAPPDGLWGYGRAAGSTGVRDARRVSIRDGTMTPGGFRGAPVFDLCTRRVVAVLSDVVPPEREGPRAREALGVPASVVRAKLPSLRRRLERPYVGLEHFGEADERYWVDPGGLRAKVLARIDAGQRLIAVVGPSGAGKSSLLLAGLMPRLRERAARWNADLGHVRLDRARALEMASVCQQHLDRPPPEGPDLGGAKQALYDLLLGWAERRGSAVGIDPATRPAPPPPGAAAARTAAIANLGAVTGRGLVLLLDQFEELLLLDPAPCRQVALTLLRSLQEGWGGGGAAIPDVHLVIALRESFLGQLGERTPELKRLVVRAAESVPLVIDEERLRDVIEKPAFTAGRGWDAPAFVATVLAAAKGHYATETGRGVGAAVLPVLQVFLARAWDAREAELERPATPPGEPAHEGPDGPAAPEAKWAHVHDELPSTLAQVIDGVVSRLTRQRRAAGEEAPGDALHRETEELVAQLLARFVRTDAGAGAGDLKGRPRRLSELEASLAHLVSPTALGGVVRELVFARVLSARAAEGEALAPPEGAGTTRGSPADLLLELVHDAIFRHWPPLERPTKRVLAFKTWHAGLVERVKLVPEIEGPNATWQAPLWGGGSGPFLSGFELDAALTWRRERGPDIAREVHALLDQSEWRERAAKRLAAAAIAGVVLLAAGLTYGGYRAKLNDALRDASLNRERLAAERQHAGELQASMAETTRYEVRALGQEPRALADAIRSSECVERVEDPGARSAIAGALLRSLLAFRLRAPFDTTSEVPYRVALTEDGREAVFQWLDDSGKDERFELWDARTGSKLRPLARREHCRPAVSGPDSLRWLCGTEGKNPHSVAFFVGADRALSWEAPEHGALLRSSPKELWFSRGKAKGVERVRLADGATVGALAPSLTITSLDRSADGSAVALGAEEDQLLIWDAKADRTASLPHAGPVLHAAVAAGGAAAITLGPMTTCRYAAGKERRCNGIEGPIERGAAAIDDAGALAALSALAPPASPTRPMLLVAAGERVIRFNEGWAPIDLDVSVGKQALTPGQEPKPYASLQGVSTSAQHEPGHFDLRFDVTAPPRRDQLPKLTRTPLSYGGFENVQLGGDGAWKHGAPAATRPCSEGSFRRGASCAGTQVVAHGEQWFRLGDGHASAHAPAPGRRVLAYSAGRHVALVDADNTFELRRVDTTGVGEPAAASTCRPRVPLLPSRDDPARSFVALCDGGNDLIVVRDTAAGPAFQTLNAIAPGAPAGALSEAYREGDSIIVQWHRNQFRHAGLSEAGLRWGPDEARAAVISAPGEGFLVARGSATTQNAVDIYVGAERVRSLDGEQVSFGAEAVNTNLGPLLWLSHPAKRLGTFLDARGREVTLATRQATGAAPGPAGEPAIEGAPATGALASPDGRWILVKRETPPFSPAERAPALLRVDADSKHLVFDALTPLPDASPNAPDPNYSFFWLPTGPKAAPRLLIARGPNLWAAERNEAGDWALRPLTDLPVGAERRSLQAVLSPQGHYVALSFQRSNWAPPYGIELRDAQTLSPLGTIAADSPTPPWFVDEEHLLLSEPIRVVSFRPDELRREACDLLRNRSEFASVKAVCEPPPSRCEP